MILLAKREIIVTYQEVYRYHGCNSKRKAYDSIRRTRERSTRISEEEKIVYIVRILHMLVDSSARLYRSFGIDK